MIPKEPLSELWRYESVRCVIVPHGRHVQVELRNAGDAPFLRKIVPTRGAALGEAESLRLLVGPREQPGPRPFALVIEDDCDTEFPLTDSLRRSGIRAFGCRSGVEGMVLARELTPDLIVLDYRFPDVPAADVCRMVRADPTHGAHSDCRRHRVARWSA